MVEVGQTALGGAVFVSSTRCCGIVGGGGGGGGGGGQIGLTFRLMGSGMVVG